MKEVVKVVVYRGEDGWVRGALDRGMKDGVHQQSGINTLEVRTLDDLRDWDLRKAILKFAKERGD